MNKLMLTAILLALLIGAGGGYWYAAAQRPENAPAEQAAKKPLFYRHPMNPEITSPVPAKEAMGMDYIPVYAEADGANHAEPQGLVKIEPTWVQSIGVRTAKVQKKDFAHVIRTVGRVAYNEEKLARLHPKTDGWIEKLYIDKTGEQVNKGAILVSIYAPQLVASTQEYLLALNNLQALKDSPYEDIRRGAEELVKSARQRLKLLDVPEHQIHELEHTRSTKTQLHIHSPFSGIAVNIGVREGQYVTPSTELYMLADLSSVWVYADIYEYELPWVKVGDTAKMRFTGIPGKLFSGRLDYIYPYADAQTRTVKMRLTFDNPEGLLKPEMFADVTVHAGQRENALVIPSEAVVRSGARDKVFVVRGEGRFEPREVELGISSDGLVQILEGVEAGEKVVTSAQFLIDSESNLREATAKMLSPKREDPDHSSGAERNAQPAEKDILQGGGPRHD